MADAVMATDAGVGRACAAALLFLFALVGIPVSAQVGDLDGDGTADVLLRDADGRWQSHGFRDLDVVAGGPVTAPLARRTEWQWAAGGDFNGNGRYDVLLRHEDGSWFFYPMNGARVGQGRGRAALARGREWRLVGVADLNRDGRDDVLLRRDDGQWAYYAMNGKNRIGAESGWVGLPRDPDWRLAGLGDFDGDGRGDVLLRHLRGAWRLYSMDGRNPVDERPGEPPITRDATWRVAGTGDFDGDGTEDILLRNPRGSWRYQTVAADGEAGGGHLPRMPRALEWRLAGIGDLDGDGSDDILLRHADGRWSAAQVRAGSEGGRRPASVGLPLDLAWLIPQRPVHFADAALEDPPADYAGVYSRATNDVRGIGVGPYYVREFGSAGTLKGVAHLTDNTNFYSLAAHEVMHAWANQVVPTAHWAHWGFSSANGVLGGFDIAQLVELGDGRYTAGGFNSGQIGDDGVEHVYSPIELYLAGYVPPEEVPDLWVAEDGAWAVDEDGERVLMPDGTPVFTASDVRTYSIEDIIATNGERIPDSGEAQWHFRAATVLVTDHPATSDQLDRVAAFTTWFSLPGDDGVERTVNFWEATGGRGTFTLHGLTSLLRSAPAEPTGLPASFGTSQSVNGRPITDPIP